jgi:hypothetical protein
MAGFRPLVLTPFENYMLADDRPGYPMVFAIELVFNGEISRPAFEEGLDRALARHPLFEAVVERPWVGHPRWVPANGLRPQLDWAPSDAPIACEADERIDIEQEVGLRLYARSGPLRSRLVALFHHASCDGFGAIQFLTDLFVGYARALDPRARALPQYPPIDAARLAHRGCLGDLRPEGAARWKHLPAQFDDATHPWFRPASPLAVPAPPGPSARRLDFPGNLTRGLEAVVFRGLRAVARRAEVTVHELIMTELFLVLRDWNRQHQPGAPDRSLSIMIPTNLRGHEHEGIPSANVLGYSFCKRHASHCDDREALLKSIHREYQHFRLRRSPALFPLVMDVARRIPGVLHAGTRIPWCASTAVLSHVGDIGRAIGAHFPVTARKQLILGNLVVTEINSAPPVRPLMRASFTAFQFHECLRLGLRCDPRLYTADQAQTLLDLFVNRVVARAREGLLCPESIPAAA